MPNHTETKVRIQGAPDIIDKMYRKLVSLVKEDGISKSTGFLEQFIGDPVRMLSDYEHSLRGEGGIPGWYSARLDAWGTKWDVYHVQDVEIEQIPEHAGFVASSVLTCLWNTAWSPCIPAMKTLSSMFDVDVKLEYIDEGLFYVGRTTIIDGKVNLEQDYSGQDVYRGMYELFGSKYYLEWLGAMEEFMDNDLRDTIQKESHQYLSEKDFQRVTKLLGTNTIVEES